LRSKRSVDGFYNPPTILIDISLLSKIFNELHASTDIALIAVAVSTLDNLSPQEKTMKKLLAVAFMALGLAASGAKADPIGVPGGPPCGTCFGSIYTLTYSGTAIASDATTQTFEINLNINTASYSGAGNFINAVSINVSSASNYVSGSLVFAPGGIGAWTYDDSGVNANGCATGANGKPCAEDTLGGHAPLAGDPTYDWTFYVTVKTGTLFTALGQASLQALYTLDAAGQDQRGITSEAITLQVDRNCCQHDVPEPQPMALLGLGLFALVAIRRKFNT